MAQRPVIDCVYHRGQIVTNFCTSQECTIPLCPICVNEHIQDHKNFHDYAEFETFDSVVDKVDEDIDEFLKRLKQQADKVDSYDSTIQNYEKKLKNKLVEAHNRVKTLVDDFFRKLVQQTEQAIEIQKEQFYVQKEQLTLAAKNRTDVNLMIKQDLRTQTKCIKSLLQFITEDIHQINDDFLRGMDKELEFKAIDLNVDYSKLHEIGILMNRYANTTNLPINDFIERNRDRILEKEMRGDSRGDPRGMPLQGPPIQRYIDPHLNSQIIYENRVPQQQFYPPPQQMDMRRSFEPIPQQTIIRPPPQGFAYRNQPIYYDQPRYNDY